MIHLVGPPVLAFLLTLVVPHAMAGTLPDRDTLPALARFATLVAALALLVAFFGRQLDAPLSTWVPWLGTVGLLVLVLVASRAMVGQRRITSIRRGLDDPKQLTSALAELEALRASLDEGSPSDVDRINVASLLIHAHRPVEAIEVLARSSRADRAGDGGPSSKEARGAEDAVVRALRDSIEASALVQLGRCDEARAVLGRIPRPTASAVERSIVLLEALLDALDGHPKRALERLDAIDAKKSRELWQYVGVVRAHALAASNREEDARALLEELRARTSPLVLQKIAAHRGPASRMAKKLLEGETAYR